MHAPQSPRRPPRPGPSLARVLGWLAALAPASEAHVERFVVTVREPFVGGVPWGASGPYERLRGRAFMEVDPSDPLNAVIVDLDKAPRNARGMVEFDTPFFILKPVDMALGNHKILYTLNNRGNNTGLIDAATVDDVGSTELYLRMGFTIVDSGWEGDVVPTATRLAARLPIATEADGSPILGRMRVEYSDRNIPRVGTFTLTLKGNASFRSYETASTDTAEATLTVRNSVNGPKIPIPSSRWAFGRSQGLGDEFVPSTFHVFYFDRFRFEKLYELIYTAKDPIVMGLGHAVTRDLASFLRYETHDAAGNPNPLGPGPGHAGIRRAYATGGSQTGGYLRDTIYLGFNEDEAHRRVFDGMLIIGCGTDRVFINVRFADPDVFTERDFHHDFLQSSYPPFTYAVTVDPLSGVRDGIMKRPATDPLVFQFDSATEFWQLRASLNIADGLGRSVPVPDNVRLYFNSSTAHGNRAIGLATPPPGQNPKCLYPIPQVLPHTLRALVVALDEWADQGIEPPGSNYPRVEDGTLVSAAAARASWPAIPDVHFPGVMNEYELLDFGPLFGPLGGVLTVLPPILGPSYRMFVPRTDADGLDIAGIRSLQIRAPLGTTTGWNVRPAQFRGPDLSGLNGSFFPFAGDKLEQRASGDPRPSLAERYGDHAGFVEAVRKAAKELVRERFLLPEDAALLVAEAEASDVLR